MRVSGKPYVWITVATVSAYFLQDALGLKWEWLVERQREEVFKRWSGVVLVLYIAGQWALTGLRMKQRRRAAKKAYDVHRYTGAFAPLFFYVHAHQVGYAYLFLLTLVYFSIAVSGLLHQEVVTVRGRRYGEVWMMTHVGLSVLLVFLAGYHVFISFYYS